MSARGIEKRVDELEEEVAAMRRQLEALSDSKPWWERIAGTFENDPIYKQAMKLGRDYRRAQQPQDAKKTSR
jgi:hypothetical protein